jgi:hypothetical protein
MKEVIQSQSPAAAGSQVVATRCGQGAQLKELKNLGPAYNALKSGVYSNSLMPWEDKAEVDQVYESLCQEFGVKNASEEILVRQLVQVTLQTKRLERSQAMKVSKYLSNIHGRKEFLTRAGLWHIQLVDLPDWYFAMNEADYQYTARIAKCLEQAKHLLENHSADLMMQVKSRYPELYAFVMGPVGPRHQLHTFGEWIASIYKQQSPLSNISELIKEMESDYAMELLWHENGERFLDVIESINAQVELDVQSNPNHMKQAVMLFRKTESLIDQLSDIRRKAQTVEVLGASEVEGAQTALLSPAGDGDEHGRDDGREDDLENDLESGHEDEPEGAHLSGAQRESQRNSPRDSAT